MTRNMTRPTRTNSDDGADKPESNTGHVLAGALSVLNRLYHGCLISGILQDNVVVVVDAEMFSLVLSPLEKGVTANTDRFHPGHVGHFELGVSSLFPIQLLASLVVEIQSCAHIPTLIATVFGDFGSRIENLGSH